MRLLHVPLVLAGAALFACSSNSSGDDVGSSAECKEFCDKAQATCGTGCKPTTCLAHDNDMCTAGTLARLKCEAEKGSWSCFDGGWAVAYACGEEISAACAPSDAATSDVSDTATSDASGG